ncbi:MAG: hypothetical protein ABJE47_06945 [bacterium]
MLTKRTLALAAFALLSAAPAPAQKLPDLAPYLMSDRAAEIALSRTAAPKHVADSAAVLVLTRTGYVSAAKGGNGFTCLVARSFHARIGDPEFWNAKVRAPHCFNPGASRTVMLEYLKRAEWVLAGIPLADITKRTQNAYASREFPLPAAGSMAFMLSPKQYIVDKDPHWVPHLMFYYDRSIPSAAWGVGGDTPTIIDAAADDPKNPVLTLLIPVRRWSDGTVAAKSAAGH